jgi:hypothetical protein
VSEILRLERRRWIPLEIVSMGQRNHHGRLTELVVTSKVLRVYMTDHSWRQKLMILSRNPFGDGGGSDWAQLAGACRILMLAAREQVGRKSLCRCNLWRQSNWRTQRIIRKK